MLQIDIPSAYDPTKRSVRVIAIREDGVIGFQSRTSTRDGAYVNIKIAALLDVLAADGIIPAQGADVETVRAEFVAEIEAIRAADPYALWLAGVRA